ncbi:MAG: hypothetical protein P8K78_00535, partial [Pirellulales bacterium]|nr:hypothetical protein [Pirellulales bacterium]
MWNPPFDWKYKNMTTNFIGCFLFVVAMISVDPGDAAEPVADTPPVGVVGTRRDSESHARLIQVPLPITGNVERRLISQIRKAVEELKKVPEIKVGRPLLVLELGSRDPMPSSGSEFEDCLKLARYLVSPDLNGIKTVAYVPQTLRGHALLVLMACDQVLMAPDSVLGGEAKSRNPPDPTIVSSYRQIAASRKTFPETIARGFVDPNQKLLRVQTENGPFLVFANELPEFTKTHTIDPGETETIFPGGEPASLTAREARNLGIVSSLAESSAELASDLGLSRNDLIRDR